MGNTGFSLLCLNIQGNLLNPKFPALPVLFNQSVSLCQVTNLQYIQYIAYNIHVALKLRQRGSNLLMTNAFKTKLRDPQI